MEISLVIPTDKDDDVVLRLLEGLRSQSVQPEEVLVMDSAGKIEKASWDKRVRLVSVKSFDHAITRTEACRIANGDIIVFLTDDVTLAKERSLEVLISVFSDPTVGASFGRQLPYNGASPFSAHLRFFNYPSEGRILSYADRKSYGLKAAFVSNAFSAYRRSVLQKIGFFSGPHICSEDLYAGAKILKAGYKIAYVPEATVYHSHNYTPLEEMRRYFDIGVFHTRENWIIQEFGAAESEGMRYVMSEIRYLRKTKKYYLLPELVLRNGLKFIGYRFGRNYKVLPNFIRKKFSMNKSWWENVKATKG